MADWTTHRELDGELDGEVSAVFAALLLALSPHGTPLCNHQTRED